MNVATQLGSEAAGVSELSLGPCSPGLGLAGLQLPLWMQQCRLSPGTCLPSLRAQNLGSFFSPGSLLGSSCPSKLPFLCNCFLLAYLIPLYPP